MAQNPSLKSKAVFDIQPGRARQEAEIAIRLEQPGCRRPEIAMKVASPRELEVGPGIANHLTVAFLVLFFDLLLPDIGRIADDRIEGRQGDGPLGASIIRDIAEWLSGNEVKKVPAEDSRVIRFVTDFSGRQVESGEMGRVHRDVAAEKLADEVQVGPDRIESSLEVIGADQKAPGAASGVKDSVGCFVDAKSVDKVDDIIARKMLAVAMAFLWTDELLKNAADDK